VGIPLYIVNIPWRMYLWYSVCDSIHVAHMCTLWHGIYYTYWTETGVKQNSC